ncbi:MAG TPA: ATPase domain-containing protein [Candidatus Limnocylindria bacterium]|nr:ATPase domain-containing protein [Candidatus Limnocylindria bacterium]
MKGQETGTEKASTGISGLDEILEGGLPRDRLYLIDGTPGVGKTTLSMQFLLAGVAAGERAMYVTLAETKDELAAVARSHEWSLDDVAVYELMSNVPLGTDDESTIFHPADIELADTMRTLVAEIERVDPDRVVIDSLSELRLQAQSALRYRRQILALKQHFAGRHSTVLMLDDRTAGSEDVQLHSIAHGVITLDYMAPLYGGDRRRLRVNKVRGMKARSGYHDFKIETGGLVVYPRLIAAEHTQPFEEGTVPSGVAELDSLLGGGLDRGTSAVLMGPPGSGKSVVATQFAIAAAARGENAAIFAFDETQRTVRLRVTRLGMRLDGHRGAITLQQIDPAEMPPGEFAASVRRAVEHDRARVIVIDSLNGYLNAMPQESFLTLQLHELLAYLSQQGVLTILVVAQHGVTGAIETPVDISYLADTVLLLRHFESMGRLRKAISVLKKRGSAHEPTVRELLVGPVGLRLGPALEEFKGVLQGAPALVSVEPAGPSGQRDQH